MEKVLQPLFELSPFTVYLLIGVFCWTEAAFFFGFVTPGELAVVTGGILASRGQIEIGILLGVVVPATVAGNATGFYLGRRWGNELLEWAPLQRYLGRSVRKAQEFMYRRGEWAIVLGRVSTPTRIITPFLAGASDVSYFRFLLFDIPASLIWAVVWITLGYVLGESWNVIEDVSGTAALLVLILFLAGLVIRWAAAWFSANQRRVEAVLRLTLRATGTRAIAHTIAPGFRWIGRRLNPGVAKGLSLTICFVALLCAIAGVALMSSQNQMARAVAVIDYPVLEWMGDIRTEEAVLIARSGLRAFHWPGIFVVAVPLMGFVFWLAGWAAALRIGFGMVGTAGGAYLLDTMALQGHVPGAEYPSVPVAVAAVLLVHTTALTHRLRGWEGAVACAAVGAFVLCTVALGTVVAGWAAPSGIVMGLALGMAWAAALELPWTVLQPMRVASHDAPRVQNSEQSREGPRG